MPFVHTALAFGVALGAVPIIIHLLTRRRHKVVRWGAMKYLLAAIEENSRRVQIEDLILLALRVLAIVLLALAVARPYWSPQRGADRPAEPQLAVILLDNSPSMSSDRGGVPRWDLARDWVRQLLAELPANSEVAIIPLADAPERMAGRAEPIAQLDVAGRIVKEMTLSARRADVAAALQAATKAVGLSTARNRSVYVVSDFQVEDWQPHAGAAETARGQSAKVGRTSPAAGSVAESLRTLLADGKTNLVAVQCSDGRTDNTAIVELERAWRIIKVDAQAKVFGTIARSGAAPSEGGSQPTELSATLNVDGVKAESRSAQVRAGRPQRIDYVATLTKEGDHALEMRSTPDLCPAGNVRYLAVEARDEVRVLCVDGDPHPPEEDYRSETFFLRVALSPGGQPGGAASQPGAGALLPITTKIVPGEQLGTEDLKNYDVVVLANVGRISPPQAGALLDYVRGGGSVLVFLGDQVDADNYNNTVFGPEGLLPMHLGAVADSTGAAPANSRLAAGGTGFQPVAAPAAPGAAGAGMRVELTSLVGPIMGYFKDEANRGGLSAAHMEHAFEMDLSTAPKNVQVHARLSPGGWPLLVTRAADGDEGQGVGGRVAVVNTSADADWGNLVAQPGAYVEMVQRLVVWLMEPRARCQNLLGGEPYQLSLPMSAVNAAVKITLPNQKTVTVQAALAAPVHSDKGERAMLRFEDTDQAGFYQVEWTGAAAEGAAPAAPASGNAAHATQAAQRRLFAVNIDPIETDLATMEPDGLKELAGGAAIRWIDVVSKEGKLQSAHDEVELWRAFLLAALAVLILETFLGRRFSGGRKTPAFSPKGGSVLPGA